MHNTILPREHSFWEKHYPGADFGCRCRVEAYTKRQLDRFGLKISNISDMPKVQEATFDISDNNAAPAHIINQKLKAHANNPNAITGIKAIAEFIRQRNVRFKEINELFTQAAQKQNKSMDSKIVPIAKTTPKLQAELGTKAEHIYLSGWTLRTHTHHNKVDAFDYSLVSEILGSEYRVKTQGDLKIIYFSKLGEYYRAAFKVTEDKSEVYLVSLVKSPNEIKR